MNGSAIYYSSKTAATSQGTPVREAGFSSTCRGCTCRDQPRDRDALRGATEIGGEVSASLYLDRQYHENLQRVSLSNTALDWGIVVVSPSFLPSGDSRIQVDAAPMGSVATLTRAELPM